MTDDLSFFAGKRVFVTGHTGFKGVWLTALLESAGAEVFGYALEPTTPFFALVADAQVHSVIGDVRDLRSLKCAVDAARPDVVFHMAAQPLVIEGFREPVTTYETNVMGTVNLLECVRLADWPILCAVNVTTDKVYENHEWVWPYRESDVLNGHDPYSNSKSCSELVTAAYRQSLLPSGVPVSTARAGNVIGGGDFAANRIITDCVQAVTNGRPISVRNPSSVRPYQHVLEALSAYVTIASATANNQELAGAFNVGPRDGDGVSTADLATMFCEAWGDSATWVHAEADTPPEASLLRLDSSYITERLGWRPRWTTQQAVSATVKWYKCWFDKGDVKKLMDEQVESFFGF